MNYEIIKETIEEDIGKVQTKASEIAEVLRGLDKFFQDNAQTGKLANRKTEHNLKIGNLQEKLDSLKIDIRGSLKDSWTNIVSPILGDKKKTLMEKLVGDKEFEKLRIELTLNINSHKIQTLIIKSHQIVKMFKRPLIQ